MDNPHMGSSLDDFLKEQGIYKEVNETAEKRVEDWIKEQERKAGLQALHTILKFLERDSQRITKEFTELVKEVKNG